MLQYDLRDRNTQKVGVGIWWALGPKRAYHIMTLAPTHVSQWHLELLGYKGLRT